MKIRYGILPVLIMCSHAVSAQRGMDTVLKGSTIEVTQQYKPRVKQSPKQEWKPQLPPADTTHRHVSFDVPQQTLYYAYNSKPLRPLALGRNLLNRPYPNYLKAGAGNLGTIYADAGIGSFYGKDYETAIHLHHISQKGKIANQQTSLTGMEVDGFLHKSTGEWHGNINVAHDRYRYYGYDHTLYNYEKDAVSQAYTQIGATVDMNNGKDTSAEFVYAPSLTLNWYGAKYNTSEISSDIAIPVTYRVNENLGIHLGVNAAIASYKADTITIANNYLTASPGVTLNLKNFDGHALAGAGFGKGGDVYFLPDIKMAFSFPDISMKLAAGYYSSLRQNTYRQLTMENPYMLPLYTVRQTKKDDLFLHLSGGGGEHFSYAVRVSWLNYKNLATYLNDSGDRKTFYISYQDVQAIAPQISARYHEANHWSAGVSAEVYAFFNGSDQYVWHQPTTRINADVSVNITSKLTTSANFYFLGGIHARDENFNNITLNPATDISLSGEYLVIPRLSVFMQINNLTATKYYRWYGYQVYGFNIYGGLRLKF